MDNQVVRIRSSQFITVQKLWIRCTILYIYYRWDDLKHNKSVNRRFFLGSQSAFLSLHAMLCYAKSLQSCPTLCDPIDGSPPGSPVPGINIVPPESWSEAIKQTKTTWKKSLGILVAQFPHRLLILSDNPVNFHISNAFSLPW